MKNHADVDAFLACETRWRDEVARLREILLDCGLDETIKWGKPCYLHQGANLLILQSMKDFLAIMFFKGALLDDPADLLEEQGENTRSARRVCIRSAEQVPELDPAIRALIASAKRVEEAGLTLPERPELVLAAELQARLDQDPALREAFDGLTPGRQREYNLYITGAKQAKTRASRVDKHVERILAGKGLRDR